MASAPWDNPYLRGHPDSDLVSLTEPYERHEFVTSYLHHQNYLDNASNRQIVANKIRQYPGPKPIGRARLTAWLNEQFKR